MSRPHSDDILCEVEDDVDLVLDALGVRPVDPPRSIRERLLEEAAKGGRFARFSERVAHLLDVSPATASECLDRLDQPSAWKSSELPGVSLIDLEGGPRVSGAIRGFVRMPAGAQFPDHEHVGEETVLVIQGGLRESEYGEVYRAGAVVTRPPGSAHGFTVVPGPDLVYLVVVQTGIRIGPLFIGPDNPNL